MKIHAFIRALTIAAVLGAAFAAPHPCAAAPALVPGESIETRYAIIRYQSPEDLERFNDRIDYSPGEWGITRLFSRDTSGDLPDRITKKVDALYERVVDMLDMRKRLKKVTIHICRDKKELNATYRRLYNAESPYRAWYIYENNTIYVNVDDLNEGILAHELAHSIIDHFLIIRPPEATAEILARYVDSNLFDSTIATTKKPETGERVAKTAPPAQPPAHVAVSRDSGFAQIKGFSPAGVSFPGTPIGTQSLPGGRGQSLPGGRGQSLPGGRGQ